MSATLGLNAFKSLSLEQGGEQRAAGENDQNKSPSYFLHSYSSGRPLLVAATVPQLHLVHFWLQNLIAIYIHFGTHWFFGTLLFVLCLFAGPRAGFRRWARSARVENGLPVYAQ